MKQGKRGVSAAGDRGGPGRGGEIFFAGVKKILDEGREIGQYAFSPRGGKPAAGVL